MRLSFKGLCTDPGFIQVCPATENLPCCDPKFPVCKFLSVPEPGTIAHFLYLKAAMILAIPVVLLDPSALGCAHAV